MSFDQYAPTAEINAPQDGDRQDPPEPGLYDAELVEVRALTAKSGKDYVIAEWKLFSGPLAGYQWPDIRGFKSQAQTNMTLGFCASLGARPTEAGSIAELEEQLKRFEGCFYTIEVVENGSFRNTWVRGRILDGEPGASDLPDNDAVPSAAEIAEARAVASVDDDGPGW